MTDTISPNALRLAVRMTDTINPNVLRLAVRARIQAGVSPRTISELVFRFVRPRGTQLERLAVERISVRSRSAFWDALSRLKN